MSTSESEGQKDAKDGESAEGGFWSAAGDFDDHVAEEHASKIIALWELGGDFEAMKPAQGAAAAEDDAGAWAAGDATADDAKTEAAAGGDREHAAGANGAAAHATGDDAGPAPAENATATEPAAPAEGSPAASTTAAEPSGGDAPAATASAPSNGASALTAAEAAAASVPATGKPDDTIPDPSMMPSTPPVDAPSVIVSEELTSTPPPASAPVAAVAAEPRRAPREETVELPTSSSSKLFLFAGIGVLGLLVVIGGFVAFSGEDPEDAQTRAAAAGSAAPQIATATENEAPETGAPVAEAATGPTEAPAEAEAEATPAEEAATDTADGVETAAAETEAVAEVAEEAPEAPPAPTTAQISVRTDPADATLELDGREVPNPYRGELEIGSTHRLSASADGHRTARESLRVSEDRVVVLRLPERPSRISTTIRRGGQRGNSRRGSARRGSRRGASSGSGRGAGFVTENPY